MADRPSTIIRVGTSTIVIFAVLFSPFLIVGLLLLWRGQQVREGLFLCALYLGGVYWICARTVELAPGRLVYRALLVRKPIDLAAVTSVSVSARPAPTLELSHPGAPNEPYAFLIKPFSKAGVAAILRHIRDSSPSAQFDAIATDLCQGDFGSITRETISARNLVRLVAGIGLALTAAAIARALTHSR